MKGIKEFLEECKLTGEEKIYLSDDRFCKLDDLLKRYKEQCDKLLPLNWVPLNRENHNLYSTLIMQKNCCIRYDNGHEQDYEDKELHFSRVTHFRAKHLIK